MHLAAVALAFATSAYCSHAQASPPAAPSPATTPPSPPHLIAYLFAGKQSNYTTLLKTLQFGKITDLDLAFADPPQCQGVCAAASDMRFSIEGESDADIDALVRAAHAAGVRVIASIGGGGGDQRIIQFYNAGLSVPLIASLQAFVAAHSLDGVDLDIEDPSNMGSPYLTFTTALTAAFHPEGKLVTAAVAPYLQASMPDAALRQFDLLNVMNYSSTSAAVAALNFYAVQKKIPPAKLVLGVPFFGSADNDAREEGYKEILAAYPNAWKVDLAGGGPLDDGMAFHYVGESTMVEETQLGKKYGGIMFWDLTDDAPAPHSLLTLIEANF
ncbi:MAG TPA: glycosyl hydrolase family 18 protein [Acidobacteriaceae bacterium]